jgi:hypothetical protein
MQKNMRLRLLLLCICGLSLFACKEKQKSSSAEEKTTPVVPVKVEDTSERYFSIRDYFDDQWNTRRGSPYTLLKIYNVNGKSDSAFVPLDSALWFSMRAPFDAADISDKKFLGLYKFDSFDDETTETTHLYYESVSPDLYLQKMDISADIFTNRVKSVYMETKSVKDGRRINQKLQYIPDRIFQVQEYVKIEDQPGKNTKLEYRYKY